MLYYSKMMINTTLMEVVPKSEYDKLLQENIRLKQRESELTGQLIDLQLKVNTQKITIDDLTLQNELLREKIKNLEKDVEDLKTENRALKTEIVDLKLEIVELKKENRVLKNEIVDLKKENQALKTEIVELKNDKIFTKLMVVIQDLNAVDLLETKASVFTKKLSRFRKNRNGEFHYIMTHDDELEKSEKKYIIKLFLNKLSEETIAMFEQNHRVVGLISYLKKHLKNTCNVVLNEDDEEEDMDIKNEMIQFFGNLTLADLYP